MIQCAGITFPPIHCQVNLASVVCVVISVSHPSLAHPNINHRITTLMQRETLTGLSLVPSLLVVHEQAKKEPALMDTGASYQGQTH